MLQNCWNCFAASTLNEANDGILDNVTMREKYGKLGSKFEMKNGCGYSFFQSCTKLYVKAIQYSAIHLCVLLNVGDVYY